MDRAGWLAFFRDLAARGLSGVALVTSDSHRGLTEQHDEWTEMRRYIGLDILAKSRAASTTANAPEEVTLTAITA